MNKTLVAIAAIGVLVGFNAGQAYERYRTTKPIVEDIRRIEAER